MKLSKYAIQNLAPYVVGNGRSTLQRSGRELVKLFNDYGYFKDVYEGALPINPQNGLRFSRIDYTEKRLNEMNDSITIRNLIVHVINESIDKDTVKDEINAILIDEGFKIIEQDGVLSIVGGVIDRTKPAKNEAYFKNIENQIMEELENAQVSILIAMAWFTNDKLVNKLKEKIKQGVDVHLLIYDDSTNRKKEKDFDEIDHTWVKATRGGKMHDKFCIIDNQRVLTGSYNWSSNTEHKNDENIVVEADNKLAISYHKCPLKKRNSSLK